MKNLTDHYHRHHATTKTNEKVKAMRDYFENAPPGDACWAVVLLSGKRLTRTVKSALLRQWAA
ncbi:MAG: ATP-dependent DNA ligase, partial [Planctomycetota bacterium]